MIISKKIDCSLDWGYSVSIEQIKKDLAVLESLGATHVEIEANTFFDGATLSIEAVCEREETEQEVNERLAGEKARIEAKEQAEIQTLKTLRAKYPNA